MNSRGPKKKDVSFSRDDERWPMIMHSLGMFGMD